MNNKFTIRNYCAQEYEEIFSWWFRRNEPGPEPDMLPEESTFIIEIDGRAAYCVTVYVLNTKAVAWVDNFVRNPAIVGPKALLREAVAALQSHLEHFARERGIRRLFCFSYQDALKKRYAEIGYRETLGQVSTFIKEVR